MIKLVFGSKNKIIKLDRHDFTALRALIRQSFSDVPVDYTLSYVDQDKDEICLNSDEDLLIMLSAGAKVNKVYVKQSLSQAIEITNSIEPSFEVEETAAKVVEVVEEKAVNEEIFKKKEEKVEYEFVEVRAEKEEKEIQKQPTVQIIEKEEVKQQVEEKVEVQAKPEVVEPVAVEEVDAKEEEKPMNKSFVISVSDTTKVEIEESQLNEKIGDIVKKMIESKVEVRKEHQVKKEEVKEEKKVVPEEPKPKVEEAPKLQVRAPSFSELVQHQAICSNCQDQYGIIGIRYQCIFCDNFNLCEACEAKINHEHALLKVKLPKQVVKKDDIIAKYRNDIFVNNRIPAGHYIPSISKDEANRFIDTSKNMINDSLAGAQRMLNDMFMKLQLSHQNPYEMINKPPVGLPKYYPEIDKPAPPIIDSKQTLKQKTDYLCDFFEITEREARHFISRYQGFTKEQLAAVYIELKGKK